MSIIDEVATRVIIVKPTVASPIKPVVSCDLDEELHKAIRDAIVSGVGFLMLTADALDIDGSTNVKYKRINKEDVILTKSN